MDRSNRSTPRSRPSAARIRVGQRLRAIPGVGPLIASAVVASIGNGAAFHKGREFAAWLGLIPKQHSTGGKVKLLGISKRGNRYLRTMFIHGARSLVLRLNRERSPLGDGRKNSQAASLKTCVVKCV
jgi:transposase